MAEPIGTTVTPGAAEISQSSGGATSGSQGTSSTPGSTSPVDISDETLVRVPGQSEPVKYGELNKRLQADYTRKTQEAAKIRAGLEKERSDWTASKSREEANLKQLAATLLARQNAGGQPAADAFAEIEKLEYLTGSQAAQLFRMISNQGFGSVAEAMKQRDNIITALHNNVQRLSQTVQQLQGRTSTSDFDSKINRWLTDGGYPAEAADLAKEVYLAYEGDDLDQEFPEIFKNRWESTLQLMRNLDKQRANTARLNRGSILTKGGSGVAGKGGVGLKGNESAKEQSDLLWDLVQASNEGDQT